MTHHPVKRRKKLIEVAIPLEAINAAAAAEKQPGIGAHPRGLHLWWARRPLAAARAVIFCQMVDDPSAVPEEFPTEDAQENERLRLFALISELVQWENSTNEQLLNRASEEICRSWRRCCADNAAHPEATELFNTDKLPGFHDPFAGGGALPLEAQRLGLKSYASDLNPVAVLINKAMIEIPPKFAGISPVNQESRSKKELIAREWKGAQGLAEDVRYYGKWMRDEAEKRIGHLYPQVEVTAEMAINRPDLNSYVGQNLNVIAWIWVRTVKSPNPAFSDIDVPLASTFMLSTKSGKIAYVEPLIEERSYRFNVKLGQPEDAVKAEKGTKSGGSHSSFLCLMSGTPMPFEYLRSEGKAGRIGKRLMAIVADGKRGRVYLSPTPEHESAAREANPEWKPEVQICHWPGCTNVVVYGLTKFGDLFTDRQLVALTTFSDLLQGARQLIRADAKEAGFESEDNDLMLNEGGTGASAYSETISLYLAFSISRLADYNSSISTWKPSGEQVMQTFKRQALPMTWDFPESNVLGRSAICWLNCIKYTQQNLASLSFQKHHGFAFQADAQSYRNSTRLVVSTDPPYYDNVPYADLSDFFYMWLRQSLKTVFPDLFATLAVPKGEELVATASRHGGKEGAEEFFLEGMTRAMNSIREQSHPGFPITIYYAFKQSEIKGESGTVSTGWEAFLEAVFRAGLALCGTWPMRTELANRMRGMGSNALASSIVLVCRDRRNDAPVISRSTFRRQLHDDLPCVLKELERSNIAPVDVAQSAIGPGMAIYSGAKAVLNPDDSPMSVREALIEINAALDEYLSQDEGELDADSRFALTFFESFGYKERDFGDAEGLAKARNLTVAGVAQAGILRSVAGKVRLLPRSELPEDWDPASDKRLCVWEATQQLIKRLEADGEEKAAELLLQLKKVSGHGDLAANCRALAYRLYNHCEKKKQAEEARSYNGLVIAWPELEKRAAAASSSSTAPLQTTLI